MIWSTFGRRWVALPGASAAFALIQSFVTALIREKLTGNRTYYVRTDGSDSNTGLADSSGGAFLTIQKAVDTCLEGIDFAGYDVTIQVRSGTYTAGVTFAGRHTGSGTLTLVGDTTTPGNVIISTTSATAVNLDNGASVILGGFKLQTTTSGNCISVLHLSYLQITGAMEYGACASVHISCQRESEIVISANYTISGGALIHWQGNSVCIFVCVGRTITLTGTPAFSNQFAIATNVGVVVVSGNTFSGAATGTRYSVTINGVINTGGGGATYLPGDVAGAAATGGQYI
jgi:hypothetical protein